MFAVWCHAWFDFVTGWFVATCPTHFSNLFENTQNKSSLTVGEANLQHRNSWYCLAHHFAALAGRGLGAWRKLMRTGLQKKSFKWKSVEPLWSMSHYVRQEWWTAASGFASKGLIWAQPTTKDRFQYVSLFALLQQNISSVWACAKWNKSRRLQIACLGRGHNALHKAAYGGHSQLCKWLQERWLWKSVKMISVYCKCSSESKFWTSGLLSCRYHESLETMARF